MALDPLAIIAVLLGKKKEVLSLRMHELQDKLPSEQLLTRLEQVGCHCDGDFLHCSCNIMRIAAWWLQPFSLADIAPVSDNRLLCCFVDTDHCCGSSWS